MLELPREEYIILPAEAREHREVLPTWDYLNNFRRYVVFQKPLDEYTTKRLCDKVSKINLDPYLPLYTHGGVILVPKREDLEKFYLLPEEQIIFAKTARDPEHDSTLVTVLRTMSAELRLIEYERGLKEHTIAKIMCDDCGAHSQHRSKRMIVNHWPVADGSPCSPWRASQYNQTYGGKK